MSSSKRQAAASPTVLHLDHVLTAIVQYSAAAEDVKAFLAALPASARASSHLAALHELLQEPRRHVLATEPRPLDALWPLLGLSVITPAATNLVRDAMPVFPFVSAGPLPAARPCDLDAVQWLRLWSHKITHYKHVQGDAGHDRSQLISILGQCHKLQVVDVRRAIDCHTILDAVTTPAHCVRSITVSCVRAETITSVDRWLGSGHADHLDFSYSQSGAAAVEALRPMLLKTTGLSSLALHFIGRGFLAPLVDVASSFGRLARLELSINKWDNTDLLWFLKRLKGPQQLRSFSLDDCHTSLAELVDVLASFPALKELELSSGIITSGPPPATLLPPTLRRVTFRRLLVSSATWHALLAGLSRAHSLNDLAWVSCRLLQPTVLNAIAKSLPNWIQRGLQNITLDDSNLDDDGASAIATSLRETTSPSGVSIVLRRVLLSEQNYVALGDALTTCRGVSIVLPSIDSEVFRTEAAKRRITYHVDSTDHLVLKSRAQSAHE